MLALLLAAAIAQAPPRDSRTATPLAGAITGVVTSDEAPPRALRRARVTLSAESLGGDLVAITGDDGTFVFDGLAPGAYSLAASKGAYVTTAYGASRPGHAGVPLTVTAGRAERLTMRLPRGAVITGTLLDVDGTPMPGVDVAVLERRPAPSGVGPRSRNSGSARFVSSESASLATDDHGMYRVYGLPAGDYFVAARPALRDPLRIAGRGDRAVTLAPVFYPSTVDPASAARVTVSEGEERAGIDIQLQYLPVASVSGTVSAPPGFEPAEISAVPEGDTLNPAVNLPSTRANDAGGFFFANLPAGAYRIVARSTSSTSTVVAEASVVLNGDDVEGLALSLQPPLSVTGLAVFQGEGRPPVFGVSRSTMSLVMAMSDPVAAMPRMDVDGVRFRFDGILPGPFRLGGNILGVRTPLAGWWLTSIAANGVELLDAASGVRENIDGAIATFSDRASQVAGVVGGRGGAVGGATVVAFSADRAFWFAGSRRIAGVGADATGHYTIRNLPPGPYLIVAATDLADGEWYDSAVLERLSQNAVAIRISGPEAQTRDLVIR